MEPAVLTPGLIDREATPAAAVALWGGVPDSLRHVSDGAAFVYRFERGGRGCYLRLTSPAWRSRAELEGELAFVQHARAHEVRAAAPVPSRTGALIEEIANRGGLLYVTAAEEVSGRPVERGDRTTWADAETIFMWGMLIGRLHAASSSFELPPGTTRRSWLDDVAFVGRWLAPGESVARQTLKETAEILEGLDRQRGVYGVVHGDLEAGNLIRTPDGELWLIDFDDCTEHWYVSEVATAAWFLGEAGEQERLDLVHPLVEGYRSEHPLDDEWLALLPVLVRLRAISVLAWYQHSQWLGVPETEQASREAEIRALIADPGRWW